MNDYPVIRGFKIVGVRKPDKQLSVEYMKRPEANPVQVELYSKVPGWITEDGEEMPPAPCNGDDWFISDDLPTDKEAFLACAPCPLWDLCSEFAKQSHAAFGVLGGKVYGRELQRRIEEEE